MKKKKETKYKSKNVEKKVQEFFLKNTNSVLLVQKYFHFKEGVTLHLIKLESP